MIKRIKVWKVAVLSIITLTVYCYIWFALRRNEIVKKTKLNIPDWKWLILPMLISLVSFIPLAFLTSDNGGPLEGPVLFYFVPVVGFAIIASAINIWWVWKFAKAAEKITRGRITASWILAYWYLYAFFAPAILQHYFNEVPKNLKVNAKGKNKYAPSSKFVGVSTLLMVFALFLYLVSVIGGR